MSEYTKIDIDICENGFVVTTPQSKESFVFSTAKKMKKWIEENIAPAGQVRDFCDGLDNGAKKPFEHKDLEYTWDDTLTTTGQIKIDDNVIDNKFFNKFEQQEKDIELLKDALKKIKDKNV